MAMVPVSVALGSSGLVAICGILPVINRTAIVSPIALPIARMMEEKIPDFAAGRITFVIVSRLSAPSARDEMCIRDRHRLSAY